jgi:hypothetical protein
MARRVPAAVGADLLLLVLFAALGRRAHHAASGVDDVLLVAAPFLIAYAAAAAALRLDRDPLAVPRGAAVWALAVVLGLLLRGAIVGDGLAGAFVAVTVAVTGSFLVGWRVALALLQRLRRSAPERAERSTA